jgi:hypothetical protein
MRNLFWRWPALCGLAVVLCACASPGAGASWACSASGLVNSRYTGGDTALIHLQGFSSGGNYPVTKSADGNVATGTTANGTAFQCVKKS